MSTAQNPTELRFQTRLKTSAGPGPGDGIRVAEQVFNAEEGNMYIGIGPAKNAAQEASSHAIIGGVEMYRQHATQSWVNDQIEQASPDLGDALTLVGDTNQINLVEGVELKGPAKSVTPAKDDSSKKIANTEWVQNELLEQLTQVLGASDGATVATIKSLVADIETGSEGRELLNTAIGNALTKANNLSGLADTAAARDNLGLKSLAEQDAANADIQGKFKGKVEFTETLYLDGGQC